MGGMLAQAHGPEPVRDAQLQGSGGAVVAKAKGSDPNAANLR
jgi:hypothetical protein